MKQKLNFLIPQILLIIFIGYGISLWISKKPKSAAVLLRPLTMNQQQCVEQEIGDNDLIYVEKETDTNTVYIGYQNKNDYYVSIFNIDVNGGCVIEFQERVWNCYQERINEACIEGYEFKPANIQKVELTNHAPAEIYISFDTMGSGIRNNAHHIFFVEKSDGRYEALLHLQLCMGLSSVEINYTLQTIVTTDDLVCDMFHGRKEHLEYSLYNGELTILADWFDE